MPHINLPEQLPGMQALLAFRPAIAPALRSLTHTLLCSDEGLSRGERELIGAYVSALNDCDICRNIHSAVAQCHFGTADGLVETALADVQQSVLPDKMKALLAVAASVQRGGKFVSPEQVALARANGATDLDIHDTVLIAGLFCLFNRYIDGLGLESTDTPASLLERAQHLASAGYSF